MSPGRRRAEPGKIEEGTVRARPEGIRRNVARRAWPEPQGTAQVPGERDEMGERLGEGAPDGRILRLSRLQAGRFLEACQFFLVPAREARLSASRRQDV